MSPLLAVLLLAVFGPTALIAVVLAIQCAIDAIMDRLEARWQQQHPRAARPEHVYDWRGER